MSNYRNGEECMNYNEMIEFILSHPFVAISHTLFDDCEYIYLGKDGRVYDENGYLFEDWEWHPFTRNGLRIRQDGIWQSGWFVRTDVVLAESTEMDISENI